MKNIINNLNYQLNDMNQKMGIIMQKLGESSDSIDTNIIADKSSIDTTINKKIIIKDDKAVKTRNKKTKAETFQKERTIFIEDLEKMMGLTDTTRDVLLHDLEKNEDLKKHLKDKIPDIQKLYKCGSWNYFIKSNSNSKVSEIGLLKSIFKSENYNIINKRAMKEIDGIKKMYSVLYFLKM